MILYSEMREGFIIRRNFASETSKEGGRGTFLRLRAGYRLASELWLVVTLSWVTTIQFLSGEVIKRAKREVKLLRWVGCPKEGYLRTEYYVRKWKDSTRKQQLEFEFDFLLYKDTVQQTLGRQASNLLAVHSEEPASWRVDQTLAGVKTSHLPAWSSSRSRRGRTSWLQFLRILLAKRCVYKDIFGTVVIQNQTLQQILQTFFISSFSVVFKLFKMNSV